MTDAEESAQIIHQIFFQCLHGCFHVGVAVYIVIRIRDSHLSHCKSLAVLHLRVMICNICFQQSANRHSLIPSWPLHGIVKKSQFPFACDRFLLVKCLFLLDANSAENQLLILIHLYKRCTLFYDIILRMSRRKHKRKRARFVFLQFNHRINQSKLIHPGVAYFDSIAQYLIHYKLPPM